MWGAVGAARACLEAALDYSLNTVQFARPITSFEIQQQKLALMALDVNNAHLLALHRGRLDEASLLRPGHVNMGKLGNVNAAFEASHGAPGVRREWNHSRVAGDPALERPRSRRHLRGHRRRAHPRLGGGLAWLQGLQIGLD